MNEQEYNQQAIEMTEEVLLNLQEQGLVEQKNGLWSLTPKGIAFGNKEKN